MPDFTADIVKSFFSRVQDTDGPETPPCEGWFKGSGEIQAGEKRPGKYKSVVLGEKGLEGSMEQNCDKQTGNTKADEA